MPHSLSLDLMNLTNRDIFACSPDHAKLTHELTEQTLCHDTSAACSRLMRRDARSREPQRCTPAPGGHAIPRFSRDPATCMAASPRDPRLGDFGHAGIDPAADAFQIGAASSGEIVARARSQTGVVPQAVGEGGGDAVAARRALGARGGKVGIAVTANAPRLGCAVLELARFGLLGTGQTGVRWRDRTERLRPSPAAFGAGTMAPSGNA